MDWATINRAGRDEDGPILGGRHVDAKLVIPAGAINQERVTELYLMQKMANKQEKANKALDALEGVSTEDILLGLAARRDPVKLADAMMAALGKYELRAEFVEAWNIDAEMKRQNGASKPLKIAPDDDKQKGQGVGDDSWVNRTSERTGRILE